VYLRGVREFQEKIETIRRKHTAAIENIQQRKTTLEAREQLLQKKAAASLSVLRKAVEAGKKKLRESVERRCEENRARRAAFEVMLQEREREYEQEVKRLKEELAQKAKAEAEFFEAEKARETAIEELESGLSEAAKAAPTRVTCVDLEPGSAEFKFVEGKLPGNAILRVWRVFSAKADEASVYSRTAGGGGPATRACLAMDSSLFMSLVRSAFAPDAIPLPVTLFSSAKEAFEASKKSSAIRVIILWLKTFVKTVASPELIDSVPLRAADSDDPPTKAIVIPTAQATWTIIPEFAALVENKRSEGMAKHTEQVLASLRKGNTFETLAEIERRAEEEFEAFRRGSLPGLEGPDDGEREIARLEETLAELKQQIAEEQGIQQQLREQHGR
jgi:hypothetical protein